MATRPASNRAVYVNTNLNTRLVVRASLSDTVSHIKDKLLLEHMKANPEIGEIKIHALKVKRRGELYTMPDSLPVSDVFPGLKKTCYLSADCSKISTCDSMQISYDPSLSEGLKTDGTGDGLLSSLDIASRKNVVSGITNGVRAGDSSKADAGKKRKRLHKRNVRDNTGLEGMVTKDAILTEMADCGNVMVEATERVNLANIVPDNSVAGKKSQNDGNNLEGVSVEESYQEAGSIDNSGALLNVKSDSKRRKKSKKAAKVQNLSDLEPVTKKGESIQEPYMAGAAEKSDALESDERKDDNVMENAMANTLMAGKSENGLSQNNQANHPEAPSTKELSLSEINHGDPIQIANAHGRKKRKKNKAETDEKTLVPATEKIVGNSQNLLASDDLNDNTVLDSGIPTEKSEVIAAKDSNLSARAMDTSDTLQEVKSEDKKIKKSKKKGAVQDMPHLELEIGQGESSEPFVKAVNTVEMNDNMMLLSQSKNPDCVEKELTISSLPDPSEANVVPDQKISDGTGKRKKKKRDKKPAGISLEKPVLEQTDNGMNISSVLLDFDISEEVKKLPNANENDSNNVVFRAEQPLGDDCTKKNIVNENQSLDRHNANIAVLAKENDIMESNLAETNNVEAQKSKKKRRKSRASTSDVQENFPVQDQKISAEISPITEGSIPIKGANISSEANEKIPASNENEANIVISQVLQTLEYDGTTKENMGNDADFRVLENENEILEFNQSDKINKDNGVTGKKSEKKRKKSQVSEADVQENSSTNGANITSSRANGRFPNGNENESNSVTAAKDSILSARAVDTSDTMQEVKSEGKKRKKAKKKGAIQDMLQLEHEIGQVESSEPFVKSVNTVEMGDEGRLLSLNDNMMLSQSKNPDCVEKELTKEPISSLPDPSEANIVPDQKISDGTGKRKKKRDKKPAGIRLEKPVLEQTDNGMNVSSVLLNFDIAEEVRKLPNANENQSHNVVFRAEQPLGDDGTKKNIVNENQSLDRHNANIAVLAKENDIMESNLVETNSGEAKKSKKKRRKSRASTSDVQENFPVLDQKISAEISPITEGSIPIKGANITSKANEKLPACNEIEANIVISQVLQTLEYDGTTKENMENDADFPVLENENKILESNQADKINKDNGVTGKKSEKKRKKSQVSEADVQENSSTNCANITSSRANERLPTGNENESNFVISQPEQTLDDDGNKKKNMVNDADCPVLVKEKEILESNLADKNIKGKSDEDKKSKEERKKSRVTASDVQENIPIKDKTISAETKENLSIKGAHVSSLVIPDKSEEHLKMVNEPAVVTDDHAINFKLHFVHEKNQRKVASGDNVKVKKWDLVQDANTKMAMKTPLEKSTFIKPMDLFQDHSKNSITNKMMTMKTPEKQNLFTKSGSIFQDNSVEDNVDDNGRTVTSDASTHDSSSDSGDSDSSSDSGDSEEEGEMSHNGSGNGKMISDSGMLEMRKILRSSEQFKKAKLIASQTEPDMDELLLDSQPEMKAN